MVRVYDEAVDAGGETRKGLSDPIENASSVFEVELLSAVGVLVSCILNSKRDGYYVTYCLLAWLYLCRYVSLDQMNELCGA